MGQAAKITTKPGLSGTTLVFDNGRLTFTIEETNKGHKLLSHPSGQFLGLYQSTHAALTSAYLILANLA